MKVSTKIGGSFFFLSLFVLIAGIAGYYGIYRLSQSLDFVTHSAWYAADGAMETIIGIQHQMIALERIVAHAETHHEQEETTFKALLNRGKEGMTAANALMIKSGLMSTQEITLLNNQIPQFLEQQAALLTAHHHYREIYKQLTENRLQFFQAITAAESFIYDTADNLNNKLATLDLKRTAVDSIRELRIHLLERFAYFEEWRVNGQEAQYLKALEDALIQIKNQVEYLRQHPFFKASLDNSKSDIEAMQSLLEHHRTYFTEAIESFKQFKNAEAVYFDITQPLLKTLTEIEEMGDFKIEHETSTIAQLKFSSKFTIIIVMIITLISALIASWMIVRAITLPLLQARDHLKVLAQGQVVKADLSYQGNDEIAEIVASTCQLKTSIQTIIEQTTVIASGNYNIEIKMLSENDQLGRALMEMTTTLQSVTEQNTRQDWLKTGQTQLSEHTSGEQDISHLTKNIISFLSHYLNAEVGLLYLLKTANPPCLHLVASYGYSRSDTMPTEFLLGEGLVGQAALDRHLITRSHRPEETTAVIQSSLAQVNPPHVIWTPFLYENEVAGVIELGLATPLSEMQQELLQQLMPNIAIAINTARSRDKMQQLLQQSQEQAEQLQQQTAELTAQQEQMQQVNEELQSQAEELQSQQEELRQTNDELETRTQDLERQREAVRIQNQALEKTQAEMERARAAIEQKAQELELASKYKSEFLANMSHELR
ncbi:MAG: GAF domain-containing protein, partial [Pseudomonadota bacterium]|nr:GAF domain-containing protein [Pseudomonadota bacterium]